MCPASGRKGPEDVGNARPDRREKPVGQNRRARVRLPADRAKAPLDNVEAAERPGREPGAQGKVGMADAGKTGM